jgi:hypothetical protein
MKMKKILFFAIGLFCASAIFGQNASQRVAVYITGGTDASVNKVLGDELVAAFARSGRYVAIERSNDFLSELSKEHSFTRSGIVDTRQIAELGKQFGAQLVCIAEVIEVFGEKYVSARLIDVETAVVIHTARKASPLNSMPELLKVTEALAQELSGKTGVEQRDAEQQRLAEAERQRLAQLERQRQAEEERRAKQEEQRIRSENIAKQAQRLSVRGKSVYNNNGRKLSKNEVRQLMSSDSYALQLYNDGTRGTAGWGVASGISAGVLAVGLAIPQNTRTVISGPVQIGNVPTKEVEYWGGGKVIVTVAGGIGTFISLIGWIASASSPQRENNIRNAVNIYNNSRGIASTELNFGVTENGVGLVLKF